MEQLEYLSWQRAIRRVWKYSSVLVVKCSGDGDFPSQRRASPLLHQCSGRVTLRHEGLLDSLHVPEPIGAVTVL